MLSIQIDLGKVPLVLAALADQRNAQLVANAAAESYVDDVHDWIEAGKGFTPHTGQLQQSVSWISLIGGGAEVFAQAAYAKWVEEGTDAHVIRPKDRKALRFPVSGGGFGFAKVINHPGSKPHPFFFADLDDRKDRMQARALSVLAARLAQGGR
jgi:hypothetical protein